MYNIKRAIKTLGHIVGFDISKYDPKETELGRLAAALNTFNINLVIDIGANKGQFGQGLRDAGFDGRIVSFEPLTDAHKSLVATAKKYSNWSVHPRCALGDRIGNINLNISANSVSSSVLPMLDSHIEAAPHSQYVGKDSCELLTLDSVSKYYISNSDLVLVKIDTQGYEWEVLDGAEETLSIAKGILIEMSLVKLYEGQMLWNEIINRLETHDFELWGLQPAFVDPRNGRTMQLDGLFFKK